VERFAGALTHQRHERRSLGGSEIKAQIDREARIQLRGVGHVVLRPEFLVHQAIQLNPFGLVFAEVRLARRGAAALVEPSARDVRILRATAMDAEPVRPFVRLAALPERPEPPEPRRSREQSMALAV